jgi:hypothetical protein
MPYFTRLNQSADLPLTTIFTPAADGLYQFNAYVNNPTFDAGAGTVTLTVTCNDGVATLPIQTLALDLANKWNAANGFAGSTFCVFLEAGQPVQVSMIGGGTYGAATWNLYVTVAAVSGQFPPGQGENFFDFVNNTPFAATLTGTEVVPVTQGGPTVQTTTQQIANLGGGGAAGIEILNLTDQTGNSTGSFTPATDGTYEVICGVNQTTPTGGFSVLHVSYVDVHGVPQTIALSFLDSSNPPANTPPAVYNYAPVQLRAQGGSPVTVTLAGLTTPIKYDIYATAWPSGF